MITQGPDGNLWFNERGDVNIGKISTAGISTEYPVADSSTDGGITAGPDGNIWFTLIGTNQVGKILLSNAAAANPLALDQTSLTFAATAGGSAPARQTISVTASSATSFSAAAKLDRAYGTWFTVTPASTSTNGIVTVAVNPSGLAIGTYHGYVSLTAGNTIELVPVTLTVSSSSSVPTILGLVNAASFNPSGQVAPGEIVTIAGTSLGPLIPQSLPLDPSGKVATSLGGVTVSFNGFLAPLIYVSPTQINCVVPYEVGSNSPVHVQVSFNGMTSSSMTLSGTALAPGIFTLDGSGIGAGAILNTSGCRNGASQCINGPSNPAPAGSMIVFYLTGEGQTTPGGVTGLVTSVNSSGTGPLTPQPLSAPNVTIGGKTATVAFYGEAPGLVSGVLQINAIVPGGLPSGNVLLHVSFGIGVQSQDVTVTLQ